ncbi:MAG TPA: hypothetical protein VHA55_12230 [Pseudorhodoplanes sp.]|nr:hypothetical protein [Pseudorhodoplanes sp.]
MPAVFRKPHFTLLLAIAWVAAAAGLLLENWSETARTLFDTDDAMRLVQMKAWLAGQGWFDLHQPRLQPPLGYDAHWSRLIDAGLAGLMFFFRLFTGADNAERLMRAIWPLLWLLPTMAAMAAIAWRIAGREAALVALLLAAVGVPGYQQFTPGRIDHHNVQIALTLLSVAATVWSDRLRFAGAAAGLCAALALAIGYEALLYLAVCGVALAIRFALRREGAPALRDYAMALGCGLSVVFPAVVPPARWLQPACDAIAINVAAALVAASAILAVAGWLAPARPAHRLALVAAAATAAVAAAAAFEPRCLKGPYAMVDPAVWPIWLSEVREMQPLWRVFAINPLTASAIAAFPAAGILSALALLRDPRLRGDFGVLAACAAFLVAALMTVLAIRAFSYAIWLGMPLVAAAGLKLFALMRLRSIGGRVFGSLLLTPLALSSGAIGVASAAGFNDHDSFSRPGMRACFETQSYTGLAHLAPGLMVADVSFGPFILALTPHSVLAAPYHRLTVGITGTHRIFAATPAEAEGFARRAGAGYIAVCGLRPPDGIAGQNLARSLWGELRAGHVPPWLAPVEVSGPFLVFRVRA